MLQIESLPLLGVCLSSAHYQEQARIHIWTISEYYCVVADSGEANWRQRFSNHLLSRGIDASPLGHVPVLIGITATTQFTNFRSVSRQMLKNMTCTPLAGSAQRARTSAVGAPSRRPHKKSCGNCEDYTVVVDCLSVSHRGA